MRRETKVKTHRAFKCDKSIAKGIEWLNKNDYYTLGCCSGLEKDHDNERDLMYIEFAGLTKAKTLRIKIRAKQFGFVVHNFSIGVRIESEKDNKLEMFNDLIEYLRYSEHKLNLRAIGISNWAYDSENKKNYSVQFYDYDYNGTKNVPRDDLLLILEMFPYDVLMYETKQGVHFISFAILLGLHTAKARVLELSKKLGNQDYFTEGKDLTLRISAKWKIRFLRKRKIVSEKPKFKGLIKTPDNLIKKPNKFLNSQNIDKYVISKNHLEFYKRYMDLPNWVCELYSDCDARDLKIKNYHYKTRD